MKNYTQRELHNEAFRDMLRGLKNVAKAGIKGAAKNVANYISPELYGLAKGAAEVYKSGSPDAVLQDYLLKTRSVPIFLKPTTGGNITSSGGPAVTEQEIIDGSAEHRFKDISVRNPNAAQQVQGQQPIDPYSVEKQNSIKARLELVKIGRPEDKKDGIFKVPFRAKSNGVEGSYNAYIDKIDKDRHQIIGIIEAP